MGSERSTAFHKGVKFWISLLLAALIAALLWSYWRNQTADDATQEEARAAWETPRTTPVALLPAASLQAVSYMR